MFRPANGDDALQHLPLTTAAQFGWNDVVPRLEANELFVATLFDTEELSQLKDFVLTLSRVAQNSFAQRLAAYAMTRYESPRQLMMASGLANLGHQPEMFEPVFDEYRLAGAIAWNRCRS